MRGQLAGRPIDDILWHVGNKSVSMCVRNAGRLK